MYSRFIRMIQPDEFRRLRLLIRTFQIQCALIPAAGVAFWLGEKFQPFFWFFGLWIVSTVLVAILIAEWRCPSCGKTYFKMGANERAWLCATRCAHCRYRRPRLGFFPTIRQT
jgi:hypothetical protein